MQIKPSDTIANNIIEDLRGEKIVSLVLLTNNQDDVMVLVTYNTEKKSEYILTASTRIYTAKLSGLPLWGTDVMTPETKIHSVGDLMVDLLKKTENALANDFHYNETLRMEVYESIKEHFVQWPPQLK